ncbi:DUF4439 domain-containing protein [Arthrobacter sp. R4]|uniref:DUF4439 domain-containing protein n=1 Tax=Arthrobacter sp. R4 TaxID=644417 RepID=UPI003EDA360E
MKADSTEISARTRYFRYAVFSLTALLVMSLGMVLIPHQPPAPAETPFSERARAAALADTLALRAAGRDLTEAGAGAGAPDDTAVLDRVVTLLTIQARTLLLPGDTPTSPTRSDAGQAASPDSSAGQTASPGGPTSAVPSTAAELAAALSASGARRLTDALEADGGMARLLAGAGAAQLLVARDVAASAGIPAEELPGWQEPDAPAGQATRTPAECPSSGPSGEGDDDRGGVGEDAALTAALDSERETIYGYQAALTRLDPAAAAQASALLAEHLDLAEQAEAYATMHCAAVPPTPPGYVLDSAFLSAPAAGLSHLESGTLPAYGDVVAFSTAPTRGWAVSALVSAAKRTIVWGGDPGAVPGLELDESQLPPLPDMPVHAVPTTSEPAT